MSDKFTLYVNEETFLKEIDLSDVVAIFETIDAERDYLAKWLPFVELTQEISFTHTFVENYLNAETKDLTCAIYYKKRLVGLVGLKDTDYDNQKTEIGFWLSELFEHKGIATNSCRTLINYTFEKLGINRIQLKAATENLKSQGVAERLGFEREGIERDGELHSRGFVDLVTFSMLKKNWKIE